MSELLGRVRQRMVEAGAGAHGNRPDVGELVRSESAGIADDAVLSRLRHEVEAELAGAGPLEPLLALPGVTDVLINAPDSVWVDRGTGLEPALVRFADDGSVRRLAQRLAMAAGRRLDDAMPYVDATLPDGTRLHAVLPPVAEHTTVSLRVLARRRHDLAGLERAGSVPEEVADLMRAIVAARLAFVVTGGTGTGKTTLLGAMLAVADGNERLLLIEDARELVVDHPHVVRLVARTSNIEGAGEISPRALVRQALRMRPDRIVVGEFRGAELVELLVALNTGHDGGAATLHANSAADAPSRFLALGTLGGLPPAAVASLVDSAVDVVIHLRRCNGLRQVVEIGLIGRRADELAITRVWSAQQGAGVGWDHLSTLLAARGVSPPERAR